MVQAPIPRTMKRWFWFKCFSCSGAIPKAFSGLCFEKVKKYSVYGVGAKIFLENKYVIQNDHHTTHEMYLLSPKFLYSKIHRSRIFPLDRQPCSKPTP